MRKIWTHSLAIFVGLVIGTVIMGYLSVRASKMYLEVLRTSIVFEQAQLGAKAHKMGDRYSELVHRSNVVTFSSPGELYSLEEGKRTWTFGFPFAALILERIGAGSEKGRVKVHAIDLGRLAEAMEGVGLRDEAIPIWQNAAKTLGYKDIERLKSFVSGLHKTEADAGLDTMTNGRQ